MVRLIVACGVMQIHSSFEAAARLGSVLLQAVSAERARPQPNRRSTVVRRLKKV